MHGPAMVRDIALRQCYNSFISVSPFKFNLLSDSYDQFYFFFFYKRIWEDYQVKLSIKHPRCVYNILM